MHYNFISYYRDRYIIPNHEELSRITDYNEASMIIQDLITNPDPCLITRFGNNEIDATIEYRKGHPLDFLRTIYPFWTSKKIKEVMKNNAGFFSNSNKRLAQFADLIESIVPDIDLLASWLYKESLFPELRNCKRVNLLCIEPFWAQKPWTSVLKGKKVLVVHPFKDSILKQYKRRDLIFDNKDILPTFKSLQVIQAIQSIGGESNQFKNWFYALEYMKDQITNADFEIAIIGCGAYGMPLAAHCKHIKKKAIHLGGVTQLLFGIRGHRWEQWQHKNLMNEYWIRPSEKEKPKSADNVEEACYW